MLRRQLPWTARAALAFVFAATSVIGLAACTQSSPAPTPSVHATPAPTPASTAPAPIAALPDGTAEENLPVFTAAVEKVWASDQRGSGRAYIDSLVAIGFDRDDMQVTQDRSTVGNPAESLQFSVRWGSERCLIGQVGPSTGGVVTAVMPQLAGGRCLVGSTRPIDW